MSQIVEAAQQYVKKRLLSELSEENGYYRYTHTLRVADIGRKIALAEGLDEEMLVLGCLLHDVGYVLCKTDEDFGDHGRLCAQIAAEFLWEQGYDPAKAESICYGIRVHTQPEEERIRPATVLENSIADADNIDRFDAWRLSRRLCWDELEKCSCRELDELVRKRQRHTQQLRKEPFATGTAAAMWQERLDLWIAVYSRLQYQMETTLAWDTEI